MLGEHRIMIETSCHFLYSLDSFGHGGYSFLKQQYVEMVPEPLQSHSSVCGFSTITAAFHLFRFRQKETTGSHDVNGLSFLSNLK